MSAHEMFHNIPLQDHHFHHQPPHDQPNPNSKPLSNLKKKRNLPGTPDPDAEVMALSPKSLMATNRFVCEICNKGFQRDQNLQLHRRGHNLPWKLKQRNNKEPMKKKVYICPEKTCVHHDPARALGDLTGIKKHFSRKHGEKKWKCEKCSKKYAVQSDWKAHSKTCGTREYKCDCGTLFSRKDSFITHRAFCDALAEESVRLSSVTPNNLGFKNEGPMSATALLQKAAQMGSTRSNSSIFGTSFVLMNSSTTTSNIAASLVNNNITSQLQVSTTMNNNSSNSSPQMSNLDHQQMIMSRNETMAPLMMHRGFSGVDNGLTRDFLGMGGEGGRPLLPQDLVKFASYGSNMGSMRHFTSNN
ncbi:hypothetical protein R6Q57_004974 [Mikania cordata]